MVEWQQAGAGSQPASGLDVKSCGHRISLVNVCSPNLGSMTSSQLQADQPGWQLCVEFHTNFTTFRPPEGENKVSVVLQKVECVCVYQYTFI